MTDEQHQQWCKDLEELYKLRVENKDLKKRAKSAESDWQICEERITELEDENEQLKKWQIKPTEAICLTDLACRYQKVLKND